MDPVCLKVSQDRMLEMKLIACFNLRLRSRIYKQFPASFLQPLHVYRGKSYFYDALTDLFKVFILFYRVCLYRIFVGLKRFIITTPHRGAHADVELLVRRAHVRRAMDKVPWRNADPAFQQVMPQEHSQGAEPEITGQRGRLNARQAQISPHHGF